MGNAVIFQGSAVKALKDILRMKTGTELITGDSDDPTVVAKDAPIGSKYLRAGTSEIYTKLDSGSSTNWDLDSADLNRLVKLGLSTGIIEGGVISVNGGNPALFDVTAGSGVVVDPTTPTNPTITFVSWTASTANSLTNLATEDDTQIGYNAAGSLQQFTPIRQSAAHATRRDVITLGVLLHFSRTTIDDIINAPASYIQNDAALHADISTAIGAITRAGNEYTNDGASLRIIKNEGETYVAGINFRNNPKNPNFFPPFFPRRETLPRKPESTPFFLFYRPLGLVGWGRLHHDRVSPVHSPFNKSISPLPSSRGKLDSPPPYMASTPGLWWWIFVFGDEAWFDVGGNIYFTV